MKFAFRSDRTGTPWTSSRGASMIEYVLLLNMLGLACLALSTQLDTAISNNLLVFSNPSTTLISGRSGPNRGGGTSGSTRNDTSRWNDTLDPAPPPIGDPDGRECNADTGEPCDLQ